MLKVLMRQLIKCEITLLSCPLATEEEQVERWNILEILIFKTENMKKVSEISDKLSKKTFSSAINISLNLKLLPLELVTFYIPAITVSNNFF